MADSALHDDVRSSEGCRFPCMPMLHCVSNALDISFGEITAIQIFSFFSLRRPLIDAVVISGSIT
jgi:hypothetical protein